jgi:penicillin amidase
MARMLRRLPFAVVAVALLAALGAYLVLRQSLPRLDGERRLAGLTAPVDVARDALGVADLVATTRGDAMLALGYVHAQERYFEMDLMRRLAAGEIAELFGAPALDADRANRVHRFRARARAVLARATPAERAALDAYVAGVNAGLADLGARPFPYLLLDATPRAWAAEDSLLVGYAMYFDLQDERNSREVALGRMKSALPASLYAFLTAPGTSWDAPLVGAAFEDPPLPPASDVDLRTLDPDLFDKSGVSSGGDLGLGSNNFAVGGALTPHGGGMVANDMHLALRVPNIWFRARLRWTEPQPADLAGVTLPGLPALVAGSNGHVAWGFTNSYGDWADWVRVHWLDDGQRRYRTPDGAAAVETHREVLRVQGGADATLDVRETIWGPLLEDESADVGLALAWVAHRPDALGLGVTALEQARSVDEAIAVAQRSAIPQQNFVVVDRDGRLGFTIIGRIPKRVGFDGTVPTDWLEPGTGWAGWLEPAQYPAVIDPPHQRLWTANARTVDGAALAAIGDGGYALGARAGQIRDGLLARERFAPEDFLAIQLDDRTLFMRRWWELLRRTLESADDPASTELRRLTETWDERAGVDARAYRFVRAFRLFVHEAVVDGLAAPMRAHDPDFVLPALGQGEGIVWKLVQERPAHLLAPRYAGWDALLAAAARRVVDEFGTQPGGLAARTWGERNTSAIRHPLSPALPGFGWLLDMERQTLPGDSAMPRVQAPSFGASERFAVAPGREAEGYFHMPGGQSGHPLSPFYGAGHADWANGRPTPFLPGAATHRLTLKP